MNNKIEIIQTPLEGLYVLRRNPFQDERGLFERLFDDSELRTIIPKERVYQINHSITKQTSVVRGLHYQIPPFSETKLISCIKGKVFDVAVDLRKGSSTFLKWYGCELSETNFLTMLIPSGFAHGFQTLASDTELIYAHTNEYNPVYEKALHVEDPAVSIIWPLPITNLSERDKNHSFINSDFQGIIL